MNSRPVARITPLQVRRKPVALDQVGEQVIDIQIAIDGLVDGKQGIVELECLLFGQDLPRTVQKDEQPLSGLDFADEQGIDAFPPVACFTYGEM